ncbi:putative nuclease HARBI1 isoform X1 [Aphis craccivora]|uniref:Putative nuclease HARBI1 isoform X1 n=1 Tax=Aphis craccivora TaxID=307492 RepID=A0A6G0Y3P1_APHCR|nr:putative nuclease HARBI1 isoform X1 [Aphis craccivora]
MATFNEIAWFILLQDNDQNNENDVPYNRLQTKRDAVVDPFMISDRLFIKNFRLPKNVARFLIEMLAPYVKIQSRSSAVSLDNKVLIALHFFGTGSYQSPVGNSRFTSVSQPTVSRCVNDIVSALNHSEIFNKWIKFPSNMQELIEVRNCFYRKTKFPGVIGCIDCTHVAIIPPPANLNLNENPYPEHIYVNRKGYHSINVQLICDANLKVLNVNALFPGSTHDTHIWNNSNVLPFLKELHAHNYNDFYLLGDSGYPLRQWLITPITNPNNEAEEYFNTAQMACRSIIERCNGVLKQRFRCLIKDRTLHYKPEKSSAIINACVVLHNICVSFKVPEINEEIGDFDKGMYQVAADLNHRNRDLILGRQQRDKIVRLFQNHN